MQYKIIMAMIALVLLIGISSAIDESLIFKSGEDANVSIPVFKSDNSKADGTVKCYFTMNKPNNGGKLLTDVAMTIGNDGYATYIIPGALIVSNGIYPSSVRCDNSVDYGFTTLNILINPTGTIQGNVLENSALIFLTVIAILLIVFGAYLSNPFLGFIGAIMLLLGGVYTMIYGFNNITDTYTRGLGLTIIGLGFVFMFMSAYEWVWGANEEEL